MNRLSQSVFGSLPHSWLLKALDIYKVSPLIINFLKNNMNLRNTNLFPDHTKGSLTRSI